MPLETGHSSGGISLRRILDGEGPRAGPAGLSIASIAELIGAGGWPENTGWPLGAALRMNRVDLDEVGSLDVSAVSGRKRDPSKVERLLRSLVRNVATPVAMAKLARGVEREGGGLKVETIAGDPEQCFGRRT